MLFSFFESIKYVGHLFPIAFLRIFIGVYYLQEALIKIQGDFLNRPLFAEQVAEWLPSSAAPQWYKYFISAQLIPHWMTLAFCIAALELSIGISYLFGYVVRPMALLAIFLTVNMVFFSNPVQEDYLKTLIALHVIFAWVGAGRCLGVDYYFYKRRRGIWW
ncbi:MAG: DoxX family protein [Bdellovibrionota bacterium]